MVLGAEIAALVIGIIALVKGKISLTRKWVVTGARARWIGALLILPIPLAFVVAFAPGLVVAISAAGRQQRLDPHDLWTMGVIIELSVFALCAGVAILIGALARKEPDFLRPLSKEETTFGSMANSAENPSFHVQSEPPRPRAFVPESERPPRRPLPEDEWDQWPRRSGLACSSGSALPWILTAVFGGLFLLTVGAVAVALVVKHGAAPNPVVAKKEILKEKQPLAANLGGNIKGRVVYDGEPPSERRIRAMELHKDMNSCLQGHEFEKREQTWIIDKTTMGVANVVVWLEPPAGSFFKFRPEDVPVKDQEIDQPHCAFIPHVVAHFPCYWDGNRYVATGQRLVVHNSGPMPHNVRVRGDELKNPQRSITLPPNGRIELGVRLQREPVQLGCDFHPWMTALVLTFDHPYHAVTDSKGAFQIDNVPTGIELTVVGWHESSKVFRREKKTFQRGENNVDWKIKK